MSPAQSVNTFNTPRPHLIVRARAGGIVTTVPAASLNIQDVQRQVESMRTGFPEAQFEIDQTQVVYARQALLGAA